MVTLDLREHAGVSHGPAAAMSETGGAAEREAVPHPVIRSWRRGTAQTSATRDGSCDGMDVPGWAVEVKRTSADIARRSGRGGEAAG